MPLLQSPEGGGYPRDYLLSRLRARRRELLGDRRTPVEPASAEAPWRAFRRECAWVFRQMDARWRQDFTPLLTYWELPGLVRAIRFIRQGEGLTQEALFPDSLILGRWQRTVSECRDGAEAAAAALAALSEESPALAGLEAIYRREGGRRFEEELMDRFLVAPGRGRLRGVVGDYFKALVDRRNLLRLAKHQRWGLESPVLLPGGELARTALEALWRQGDLTMSLRCAAAWAGEAAPEDWRTLSVVLERGLLRRLRRWGRDPLQAGVVLDYLGRCRLRARNLSLLARAGEAGREEMVA